MEVDFVKPDVWLQSQGERPQFYQNLLLWSVSACCSFGYYAWVKRCPRALLLAASLHKLATEFVRGPAGSFEN